jgi:hypothetical protein
LSLAAECAITMHLSGQFADSLGKLSWIGIASRPAVDFSDRPKSWIDDTLGVALPRPWLRAADMARTLLYPQAARA